VRYKPSSDGSFVPGISGPDGEVKPGQNWTYELEAIEGSAGDVPIVVELRDDGPGVMVRR